MARLGSVLILACTGALCAGHSPGNVTCSVVQDTAPHIILDCGGQQFIPQHHSEKPEVGSELWLFFAGCALGCIVCAALAAGLTLGLTSIEEFELRVLCNHLVEEVEPSLTPRRRLVAQKKLEHDQSCAKRILPLISGTFFQSSSSNWVHKVDPSNQHYLLVTLLLLNATANEALPLFLDRLVPSWMACLLSVTVVLFFGEIIPSAVFTGPRQLSLAAALSPLVGFAKRIFVFIVWPISLMLDKVLGHSHDPYSRAQIKALIRTINTQDSSLEIDEANMLQGVLEMHHKKAQDIAHALPKAKMVPHDRLLTEDCIKEIMDWGHSRLFVYRNDPDHPEQRDDIIGVVLVKKLLGISFPGGSQGAESKYRIGNLMHAVKRPVVLHPDDNLLSTLNKFQGGTCHLAVISPDPALCLDALRRQVTIPSAARPTMFCSLEDVIEEMLKEEIFDEEDKELQRHAPIHASAGDSALKHGLKHNLMLNIRVGRPRATLRTSFSRSHTSIGETSRRRVKSEGGLSPLARSLLDMEDEDDEDEEYPVKSPRRTPAGNPWKAFSENLKHSSFSHLGASQLTLEDEVPEGREA